LFLVSGFKFLVSLTPSLFPSKRGGQGGEFF
jgi:hypothetical protein